MTDDDETVADVLGDVIDGPECTGLCMVAEYGKVPEDMTYEDWVRPMKLTGGRVCLRYSDDFGTYYTRRRSDGHLETLYIPDAAGEKRTVVDTPSSLKTVFENTTPEPVLREDTPFGEVDDE